MKDLNLYKNLDEAITDESKSELIRSVFENKTKSLLSKKKFVKKMAGGGGINDGSQEVYSPYEFLHTLLPLIYGRDYVVSDEQAKIWDEEIKEKEAKLNEELLSKLESEKAIRLYDLSDKQYIESFEIKRKGLISRKAYITKSELQAYLYCHPEINKSFYMKEGDYDSTLTKSAMIKKGLIMMDFVQSKNEIPSIPNKLSVQYIYRYEYLSGNLYKKMSNLKRYRGQIIEQLTSVNPDVTPENIELLNSQLDYQLAELEKNKPLQAIVTLSDYNRIYLHPNTIFCKEIFEVNTTDWLDQDEGYSSSSLIYYAFKWWITEKMDTILIKNGSNPEELVSFYCELSKPSDSAEDINKRKRAFIDGDFIFNYFINEVLTENCKTRLTYQWNELYNNYTEQLFYKIPIALTLSKTFKGGDDFYPNETQVQSVQYIKDAGSGLLAYGVGVGKTASAIMNVSYALDHNLAKKPLFVVPLPTYAKWIKEIKGGEEVTYVVSYKENEEILISVFEDSVSAKKFSKSVNGTITEKVKVIQGLLPHLPNIVGLGNLNSNLVKETLKDYTESEIEQMELMIGLVEYVRALPIDYDFKNENINSKIQQSYDDFELDDLLESYKKYTLEEMRKQKSDAPKLTPLVKFFLKIISSYSDELIYILGTIKEFPDKTIFICTYESLQKIGLKLNDPSDLGFNDSIFGKLFNEITQGEQIQNFPRNERGGTAKLLEDIIYGIDSKAKVDINEFGWDYAVFDESHTFKKVFTESKPSLESYKTIRADGYYTRERLRKYNIGQGDKPTSRAVSGWMLTRIIQMNNNGNNTIQLTATPFTNKPAEIFSMLALTNYKRLVESGYKYIQDFFDLFMKINYEIIITASQNILRKEVLVGFNNLPQMRRLIYGIMDYKSGEDANIKRPDKILYPSIQGERFTTLPASSEQEKMFKDIKQYIRGNLSMGDICESSEQSFDIEEMSDDVLLDYLMSYGSDAQKEKYSEIQMPIEEDVQEEIKRIVSKLLEKEGKNAIAETDVKDEKELAHVKVAKGIQMLKQTTLSPYLSTCKKGQGIEPTFTEYINSSPKLLYTLDCIKSIHSYEAENNLKKSGIVIYMNIGVHPSYKGSKWSIGGFEKIKEYLVNEMGYEPSEVSIISGKVDNLIKEKEKNKFLSGKSTVLIGSSTISTGVDLQNNASALFLCSFDWNPTDNEQINGRIHRQGGRFAEIRIVYPMIMNSADPIIFQLLNEKSERIKSIWDKDDKGTTLDLKDFDPNKFKKDLLDDPEDLVEFWMIEQTSELSDERSILLNRYTILKNSADEYSTLDEVNPVIRGWLTIIDAYKKNLKKEEIIQKIGDKVEEAEDTFASKKEELKEKLEEDDDFGAQYGVEMKKAREKYEKDYAKATEGEYDYKNDPDGKFKVEDYYSLTNDELLPKMTYHLVGEKTWLRENVNYNTKYEFKQFIESNYPDFYTGYFTKEGRKGEYYNDYEVWNSGTVESVVNEWKGAFRSVKKLKVKLDILGIPAEDIEVAKQTFVDRIEEIGLEIKNIEGKRPEMLEVFSKQAIENKKEAVTISERVEEFAEMNKILKVPIKPFESDKAKVVETFEEKLDIKPKVEEVIIEEKEVPSEAEFLTDKIEVWTDLLDLESDESEIEFLKQKIDVFKDLLDLL
jgi:hypothetical protein